MEELAVWLFILSLVAPPLAVVVGGLWLLVPRPGRRAVHTIAPGAGLPAGHGPLSR